ncbi:MAG: tetratricopeptide repeat protein [Bacteroidetes bacterium]|nr:tetratricopeptide repeat protein [Bacteroidota bacterium]
MIQLGYFKILRVLLCFSAVILFSCTTKKNTLVTRTFHNITSKYNGYFNGNESFKEGVVALEKSWVDDYLEILPMYQYGNPVLATSVSPQMEKAIQKATTVIQRHEITAEPGAHKKGKKGRKDKKPKAKTQKTKDNEFTFRQWIDDSYLLIGKSHFYKCDYPKAVDMFEYVSKKYKKYPTRFDAMLWLIRSFTESKEIAKAQTIFDLLNDKKISKKMTGRQKMELTALQANFYLKEKNYSLAMEPLTKAVDQSSDKSEKTRFTFILGQLYETMGNREKAMHYYTRVLNMSPDYEMSFNAQLKRARLADVSDRNRNELVRQLKKMVRDEKNKDYLDQLYLALADVMQKEHNIPLTIEYLKFAAAVPSKNATGKGHAYLRIADIYFGNENYVLSKLYYDSALSTLPETFTGYAGIRSRRNILKDVVKYIITINTEDSLLKLAAMTEKERERVVQGIINRINEEEAKKKQEEQSQIIFPGVNPNMPNPGTGTGSTGQWYFYNPATVSFGYAEFLKRWGNRKPEDNWRRTNKMQTVQADSDVEEDEEGDETPPPSSADLKNKNFYLKNIPLTSTQQALSETRIIEAYYSLGIIFKEQLQNYNQAIRTFDDLMKKYPNNKYQLPAYYQLYRLYLMNGDIAKSNYYKNIIVAQYPHSDFARIITDPEYIKELQSETDKAKRFYEETYRLYSAKMYGEVISRCSGTDSLFPKNPLLPKFDFLRAMATGYSATLADFERELRYVIKHHPGDPVEARAQEILNYIMGQKGKIDIIQDTVIRLYEIDEKASHYYIFIGNRNIDIEKQKILFSNYNSVFFSSENLKVESMLMDTSASMIIIKEFPGKEKAMIYYEAIKKSNTVLVQVNPGDYSHFIISSKNFPVFYEVKNTGQYLAFFEEKYLKK